MNTLELVHNRYAVLSSIRHIAVFACIYFALAHFMATLPISLIDDTCVYFNYAKNMIDGNLFSYDARGIPSEGFTSLIFLLLIIPFEFFKINPLFSAITINVIALAITIYLGMLIYRITSNQRVFSYTFLAVFSSLLFFDSSIKMAIGMGFESILSPMLVFAAFHQFIQTKQQQEDNSGKASFFSVAIIVTVLFCAMLVRPENILIIAVFLILSLVVLSVQHMIYAMISLVVYFSVYMSWKFLYFADMFPTAYYRKLSSDGNLLGYDYVMGAISDYMFLLMAIVALMAALLFLDKSKNYKYIFIIALFMLITVVMCSFFLFVSPIVGYGNRFLILPIFIIYFIFSYLLVLMLETAYVQYLYNKVGLILKLNIILFIAMLTLLVPTTEWQLKYSLFEPIGNFYSEVSYKFNNHPYIKFGAFLKSHLQQPENVTLAFEDAGCVPYASNFKFIDLQGLTEPPIARMFRIADKKQLVKQYVNYILSYRPDIVVIGYGPVGEDSSIWLGENLHSPFGKYPQISLYESFRDYGFKYVCSFKANDPWDIHLAVHPNSMYANQVIPSILEFCRNNGYFLSNGLIRRNEQGEVLFQRHF